MRRKIDYNVQTAIVIGNEAGDILVTIFGLQLDPAQIKVDTRTNDPWASWCPTFDYQVRLEGKFTNGHGTGNAYNRGCRCNECREHNRLKSQRHRDRSKAAGFKYVQGKRVPRD